MVAPHDVVERAVLEYTGRLPSEAWAVKLQFPGGKNGRAKTWIFTYMVKATAERAADNMAKMTFDGGPVTVTLHRSDLSWE